MFYDMAHKIYNMNDDHKPDFNKFYDICKEYFPTEAPPQGPPDAATLHNQAQRARPASSAGMDGARPIELKMLPLTAWNSRREVRCLAHKLHKHPESYYNLASPVIPNLDKLEDPERLTYP